MKSLVKYFIIGFKEIFSNKILIISLSIMNLFLISGVVYKAVNNKKELNKYEDLRSQIIEKMETKLVIEENSSSDSGVHGVTKITNCLKKVFLKKN